jgi:hypothetical protein
MRWQALVATVFLSGCQVIQAFDRTHAPSEASFLSMWNLYSQCRSRSDVDQMWQDAQQLHQRIRVLDHAAQAAHLLPDSIEQALAEPPPRLAVDPKAMAADCTLLAGQAAQNAGHGRFAAEMFRFVLFNFSQPRYAYYRSQARRGLNQVDGDAGEHILRVSVHYTSESNHME